MVSVPSMKMNDCGLVGYEAVASAVPVCLALRVDCDLQHQRAVEFRGELNSTILQPFVGERLHGGRPPDGRPTCIVAMMPVSPVLMSGVIVCR